MALAASDLCQRLQAALAGPREADAAELAAAQLAQSRCRIRLYADPEATSSSTPLPEDCVLVCLTFQNQSVRISQPVRFLMPRTACVADLKAEALMAFDLPPEVQRCIVSGRLPRDDETLQELVVEAPGSDSLLKVRTYVITSDQNLWPPDPSRLEHLKGIVRAERLSRLRQSVTPADEGSAGSVEQPDDRRDKVQQEPGWCCAQCTFRNHPSRPGCHMCDWPRPEDYQVPAELQAEEDARQEQLEAAFLNKVATDRERNLRNLMTLAEGSIIQVDRQQAFECPVCLTDIGGDEDEDDNGVRGVRLRECGHEVCSACLRNQALNSDSLPVRCPCELCQQTVTDAELIKLLSGEELAHLQRLGLRQAEAIIANAFHCVTPNCEAFVELADEINDFECVLCGQHNCVTCRASHKDITCQQYQEELRLLAKNDGDAKRTLEALEAMLQSGEAMQCPQCKVFLQKKEGCDWLTCSVCKTEICWATKGPRWGPAGKGDITGGCRCRVNKQPCHPQCMNCH